MTLAHLVVHHGNEAHATGHHLVAGLRSLGVLVTEVGVGHDAELGDAPRDAPLLWIESGCASFPLPADLTGRRCAAWLIDTHRGLEWRGPLATAFDHCFVAQLDAVPHVEQLGVSTSWLPLASFDAGTSAPQQERSRDVGFVGFVEAGSRREKILDRIATDFDLYRNHEFVSAAEIPAWYRQVSIVLNVPLAQDLNMRVFEAASAGASVVTGPMNGLAELEMSDGVYLVDSDDPADWSRAVQSALDDVDRAEAAQRLQAVVLAEHTYVQRAQRVLDTLDGCAVARHDIDERRRVISAAAVHRHAMRQAWAAAETNRVRFGSGVPEAARELARTIRRRITR